MKDFFYFKRMVICRGEVNIVISTIGTLILLAVRSVLLKWYSLNALRWYLKPIYFHDEYVDQYCSQSEADLITKVIFIKYLQDSSLNWFTRIKLWLRVYMFIQVNVSVLHAKHLLKSCVARINFVPVFFRGFWIFTPRISMFRRQYLLSKYSDFNSDL